MPALKNQVMCDVEVAVIGNSSPLPCPVHLVFTCFLCSSISHKPSYTYTAYNALRHHMIKIISLNLRIEERNFFNNFFKEK